MIKGRQLNDEERQLLEQYDGLIRGLTRISMNKMNYKPLTYEDYLSFGYEAAITIVKSYDKTKCAKFSTFLYKYFNHFFFRWLKETMYKDDPMDSLDKMIEEIGDTNPQKLYLEPQNSDCGSLKNTLDTISSVLSEKQLQALLLHSSGITYQEVGQIMGCSKQNSEEMVKRAIRKVKENYNYDDNTGGLI